MRIALLLLLAAGSVRAQQTPSPKNPPPRTDELSSEDRELVKDLALLEQLELVKNLELFEPAPEPPPQAPPRQP